MAHVYRFVLVGDPVEHSRSPRIHRAAMEATGIEGDYTSERADEAKLEAVVKQLRKGLIDGINVTMPLKTAASRLCDVLSDDARASASVNTLRATSSGVEGESTDTKAAREVLGRPQFDQGPLLILGGGGAAAAMIRAARHRNVAVAARNPAQAQNLIGAHHTTVPFGTPLPGAVVVNATPLGMKGEDLPPGVVAQAAALLDLAYGETQTPAVGEALRAGTPVVDGVEFLALQAAHSFEWWTDLPAPRDTMVLAARND